MKREDLIKLITDNFAEGEEVYFRYIDDFDYVVSQNARFDVHEDPHIDDGYWTILDKDHNVIKDRVSDVDLKKTLAEIGKGNYAFTEWNTSKYTYVKTKVIEVAG